MKPYKNLYSHNLGLLLFLARILAVLGMLLTVISIGAIIFMAFLIGLYSVTTVLVLIPISLSVLVMSGIMAALVAFEENYRLRTEHLLNQNKS